MSFWCDSIIGFYTLEPVIRKYQQKNIVIYIYVLRKDIDILSKYLINIQNIKIIEIESIDSYFLRILSFIFKNYLTSPNFTKMYFRQRKVYENSFYHKFVGRYFYFNNKKINSRFQWFFGLFKNKIKGDVLVSISRVKASYLICSKSVKHISIMESWDHPVKSPYWHKPNYLLTWNKDLKKDYQFYQNFKDIKISYINPLKFRYINERFERSISSLEKDLKSPGFSNDIDAIKNKNIIMYICTTSSINPEHHYGEMKLINQICKATKEVNKVLYIKPKPNGPMGDYDIYKEKYDNVIIGTYATDQNGVDMLNEEYHTFRYLLLYYSCLVINFGTTFVLEASIVRKPILQLKLSKEDYGKFGMYSDNLHIKKYLLNKYSFTVRDESDLTNILRNEKGAFKLYSKSIRKWVLA